MTKEDTFEFGNTLATWLNTLQVEKCSAFATTMGTSDEMFGTNTTPGTYEKFIRKATEEKDTMHFMITAGHNTE